MSRTIMKGWFVKDLEEDIKIRDYDIFITLSKVGTKEKKYIKIPTDVFHHIALLKQGAFPNSYDWLSPQGRNAMRNKIEYKNGETRLRKGVQK